MKAPFSRETVISDGSWLSPASSMGSGANSVIFLPWVMDDAFAEQVEVGPTVHLSFEGYHQAAGRVHVTSAGSQPIDQLNPAVL